MAYQITEQEYVNGEVEREAVISSSSIAAIAEQIARDFANTRMGDFTNAGFENLEISEWLEDDNQFIVEIARATGTDNYGIEDYEIMARFVATEI